MNNRKNPKHIMRIFALVLSIALVFSGITVFYAAEGDENTGSSVSTGDVQPAAEGQEGDAQPDQSGSQTVTTPSDTTGTQGGSQTVTTASDTPSGEQSGTQTTPSDTPSGDDVTTPSDVASDSDAEDEKCPFCGSTNYDSDLEYVEEMEWCADHYCHEHSESSLCEVCLNCGGCTDSLYGVWCYKDGKRCKACTCFELTFLYGEPSHTFSQDEVQAKVGKEEINVDVVGSVYVLQDNGKLSPLTEFIADNGAKITARKVTMDSKYNTAVFLNAPAISDTENARFSYAFTNPIAAGNSIPMDVELTVAHNGVSRTLDFTFTVYITDGSEDFVKKIELAEGSEKLVLEAGETAKVVYSVTMDETHKDSFYAEAMNTNGECIDFGIQKDLDKMQAIITIQALEVGKSSIVVSFGEGDDLDSSADVERRTISVEVVEPSAPAAPGGSVYFDETTIKSDESVRLNARGWYDGKTLADSTRCYLPASWSVNPSGSWEIPTADECPVSDAVMSSLLTQSTPELKNLAVKEHTGRITFQGYERKADGWYPISDDLYVGSAKLKVEAASSGGSNGGNNTPGGLEKPDNNSGNGNNGSSNNGGNSNNGTGEAPGTGDIIRENPGVKTAGIVMLVAGLFIFGTLAAERIYREMQARKRQAEAVRR